MLRHESRRPGGRRVARRDHLDLDRTAPAQMIRWLAVAIVMIAAPARASTVMALDRNALEQGSDRIVEGTVVSRVVRWNDTHTGLETHATIAVEATRKGASQWVVEVVVPGGELDGGRHIVVGMPSVAIG